LVIIRYEKCENSKISVALPPYDFIGSDINLLIEIFPLKCLRNLAGYQKPPPPVTP